jgi:cytochrome c553
MYRILSIRPSKRTIIITVVIALLVFFAWRFIRPMNIFIVDDRFAWPVDTSQTPAVLGKLSAKECATCHQEFYDEWQTTIHSQAWTEPYFRVDWKFDGSQHSCRLCHTPLDRQQPQKVLGYRDTDKWDPIVEDNPDFDSKLQHEGVTCAACHYREGKIVGVLGNTNAPHPVKKLDDPNQVCVRCHIVEGDKWDTFFRFPPCGTVAEIKSSRSQLPTEEDLFLLKQLQPSLSDKQITSKGHSGERVMSDTSSLGCVECHMPLKKRPLVKGGEIRETRQHFWRGGHDPEKVKSALTIKFAESKLKNKNTSNKRLFTLNIMNTGAAHYVPTGTPDRHLTIKLRVLDKNNNVLDENTHKIIRKVMWRPFIIDLKDTRLPRWQPRSYQIDISEPEKAVSVEAVVRYHLLDEKRRKRIGYENKTPIAYDVFRQKIELHVK